jgi:hypothetical protein
MAQTSEKFSKRFSKLFVAIDDQYFPSRVPHGRRYEHKACHGLQMSVFWYFIAVSVYVEMFAAASAWSGTATLSRFM